MTQTFRNDDGTYQKAQPFVLADGMPQRFRDVVGRMQVVQHSNIYEADFEYGTQPLRWQSYTAGSGTISAMPGLGGVQMNITTVSGDITIRQSRPYHRYQPGKTMRMETAVVFGAAQTNQRQRVGFFDDGNGIFFEQGDPTPTNPYGMFCVYRSDVNGVPFDTRISFENWTDFDRVKSILNWNNIQMLGIEYAWYGAGALRWSITLNGERRILHQIGIGNLAGQITPWCRTGNLPVRYEQRNIGTATGVGQINHYGVSVLVEGGQDSQRGFTYAYGMALATPQRTISAATTRFPVLSFRPRNMGTQEYTQAGAAITGTPTTTSMTVAGTPWTVGQWAGRYVYFPGTGAQGTGSIGRITANSANTLTYADNITGNGISTAPTAGASYQIGLINRGLIKPLTLVLSSTALCTVEIISSTPSSPVTLTGASFAAMSTIGSPNSLSERDVSATALSGGEVVLAFVAPAGGSGLQTFDLTNLFSVYNTIQGNLADILTIAVSTPAGNAASVGAHIYGQEAMS